MPMRDVVQTVDPRVEQAVWSAVCAIPGCILSHVHIVEQNGIETFEIGVDAWSPSLHHILMEWQAPYVRPATATGQMDEADAQLRAILSGIALNLAIQRQRSVAGLRIGQARPVRAEGTGASEVAHLRIDASLLALLVREGSLDGHTPAETIRREIAKPLSSLHTGAMDNRGGHRLNDPAIAVEDSAGHPVIERAFMLSDPADTDSRHRYWDRTVTLQVDPVPQTAAVHAVGQPLGRFAQVDPLLDDRIVEAVEVNEVYTSIVLQPHLVRIGDLLPLGAFEAVETLSGRHR